MGVYAYCVTDAGHGPPDGLAGLGGSAVRAMPVDGLIVWVSDIEARPEVAFEAVATHHEIVSCAASLGSVAPLQFGAWVPVEPALRQRVSASKAGLVHTLRAVEGSVELGVRIVERADAGQAREEGEPSGRGADDRAEGPGRAYMRRLSDEWSRRRARRALQDALAEQVSGVLAGVSREQRVQHLEAPELVALAHLVRRDQEGEYRRRIGAFASRAELEVHLSGPWPPYSFARTT